MRMKQLYWIDDDFKQMLHIMQGAISKFWKLDNIKVEGIASKVFIFGNASKIADTNELPSIQDEKKASQKFFDLFLERCLEKDGPDEKRPVFNARKNLIQNPVCYLYKKDKSEDLETYQNMKEAWITKDLTDENNYKTAQEQACSLIKRMEIEPQSVVGIDIALLYGDRERLLQGKRILSMELCNQIEKQEKNIKYFMYSTEADEDEIRQEWIRIYEYENKYKSTEIKIYQRKDFMQKGNSDIVKEIEEMFKTNGTDDEGDQNDKSSVGRKE